MGISNGMPKTEFWSSPKTAPPTVFPNQLIAVLYSSRSRQNPWSHPWVLSFISSTIQFIKKNPVTLPVKQSQNPAPSHTDTAPTRVQATASLAWVIAIAPLLASCPCTYSLTPALNIGIARVTLLKLVRPRYNSHPVMTSHLTQSKSQCLFNLLCPPRTLCFSLTGPPCPSPSTSGSGSLHCLFLLPSRFFPENYLANSFTSDKSSLSLSSQRGLSTFITLFNTMNLPLHAQSPIPCSTFSCCLKVFPLSLNKAAPKFNKKKQRADKSHHDFEGEWRRI